MAWPFRHRPPDHIQIGHGGAVGPCGIGSQHGRNAVPVLLGDPEGILAEHEVPADRGVTCTVGLSVSDARQTHERFAPSGMRILQVLDRRSGLLKKEVIVIDLPGADQCLAQCNLAVQHLQRPGAEFNASIISGLGAGFVDTRDARLVDCQSSANWIEVGESQRNLLGGTQPGKESKLVVVALRCAPVAMDDSNECLGVLNGEGINRLALLFSDAHALQAAGGIVPIRVVAIAEFERPPQHADCIVVGLLAPGRFVGDADKKRISHRQKGQGADFRSPNHIQDSAITGHGNRRQVGLGLAGFAMRQKGVKQLITGSAGLDARHRIKIPEIRKLVGEREGAGRYAFPDANDAFARAPQVRFGRRHLH